MGKISKKGKENTKKVRAGRRGLLGRVSAPATQLPPLPVLSAGIPKPTGGFTIESARPGQDVCNVRGGTSWDRG